MTRLKYPTNGLYKGLKTNMDNSLSMLSKACDTCDYSTPSNFKYKNYLNNLSTLLNNYKKEMSSIVSAIKKIDNNYEELDTELYNKAKALGNYEVENRERLVTND